MVREADFQAKCNVEGCPRDAFSRGLCRSHYEQIRQHGHILWVIPRVRNGRMKHPLYSTWNSMVARCYRKSSSGYSNYGGRGISVCERWRRYDCGFENFVKDMGPKPDGYTLDRIDNDGDYCPENCRWVTRRHQNINKRNNKKDVNITEKHRNKKTVYEVGIKSGDRTFYKDCLSLEDARIVRDEKLKEWSLL